jgi:translation initiation factor RLI1
MTVWTIVLVGLILSMAGWVIANKKLKKNLKISETSPDKRISILEHDLKILPCSDDKCYICYGTPLKAGQSRGEYKIIFEDTAPHEYVNLWAVPPPPPPTALPGRIRK